MRLSSASPARRACETHDAVLHWFRIMRDIAHKCSTLRTAHAQATLRLSPETLRCLREGKLPKGDPLPVARVAGIQAAKNTSQIIPYCHPIPIDFVGIDYVIEENTIAVEVSVKSVAKTGVEMEALTAASVAVLTLYDMMKVVDESMEIVGIKLVEKTGGKSDFRNAFSTRPRAAVLVLSDSISAGQNEDQSGKLVVERLQAAGISVEDYRVIADESALIEAALVEYADDKELDLVITSGGTGLSPRDHTPEATQKIIQRPVPGIAEAGRGYGQDRLPYAMLSRGVAGLRGATLIVNLPGSRSSTVDYLEVLFPAILHALRMVQNAGHGDRRATPPGYPS